MSVTIDGRPLSALGVTGRVLDGWLDGPAFTREVLSVPGLLGVLPQDDALPTTRQMRLVVNLPVASLTARNTGLATLHHALLHKLLTLRFDDTPGRIVRATAGTPTVVSIAPNASMNEIGKNLIVSIPLEAYDGASYDAEPVPLVLGATPVEVALGSLPSPGIIQWSGSWSSGVSRTLTYRGVNGIAYGSLTLTPPSPAALSSSEFLEIDLGRMYITHVTNTGVRTNAYAWKSAGEWFVPEPSDALPSASRWPTLEVSAGVGLFLYRKAYAL